MTEDQMTRRTFLGTVAAGSLVATLPAHGARRVQVQSPAVVPPKPRGALRAVHMTDWHLMDQRDALRGIGAALDHALALRPDLVLNTGDMLTHAMTRPLAEIRPDMDAIERAFARFDKVPTINTIGNHDVWGTLRAKSHATGDEALFGKRWWAQRFGQGQTYRCEDAGGWHIVALDSIQPQDDGYITGLDDEQFAWLQRDLASNKPQRPVLILTHAPIVCAAVLLIDTGYRIGRSNICMDAPRLVELFERHPNVRLALSGHMHMRDRVVFQGMTHVCGGAVCGNWWRPSDEHLTRRPGDPSQMRRPPRAEMGYGLLDLFPDGRFEYRYIRYPWVFVD